MKTNEDRKYNGWTNYPTWNVKLWIDNDEAEYRYWLNESRAAIAMQDEGANKKRDAVPFVARELQGYHEESTRMVGILTGWQTDCLGWALGEVNWYEIAEAYVEEAWDCDRMSEDDEAESIEKGGGG